MAGDILVLSEQKNGELDNITYELLSRGRQIADQRGSKLAVLVLGHKVQPLAQTLAGRGVDVVLVADHPSIERFHTEIYCQVTTDVVRDFQPGLFLMGYTYWGMEIGPAVATRLGATMVSNCVDLIWCDGKIVVTRPMYGGTIHTKAEVQGAVLCIVSVQKGVLPREALSGRPASVIPVPVKIDEATLRAQIIDVIQAVSGEIDITKADVLVAVGRGIKDKANIPLAKDLADALGGVVACSRPVADLGWLPPECHVGISGKTVAPKVYIACGISGASQHTAGIIDSGTIVAVNNDPNAPIFGVADYGVVGDLLEIMPALTAEARKSKSPG